MNKLLYTLLSITFLSFLTSCGPGTTETTTDKNAALSAGDRALCTSLKIDSAIIIQLRELTQAKLDTFTPEPLWIDTEEGDIIERPSELHGVYFEATQLSARQYILELGPQFQKSGYTIYLCEENFGIDNLKDKVAIVPTADKYTILKETGTDGINYDIDNDSLVDIIKTFDAKYELTLIGCHTSWCEFTFAKEPTDWLAFAEECYTVCPDIVDQGTGTVEELAAELQRTKTLYFWWD